MVSPQAKRQAVEVLKGEHGFGVTRACGLVDISRSLYRYRSRRADCARLRERLSAIAGEKRRYGYRRIHVLLRREGWKVNKKKTYRLYREMGLRVRRRKRKRIGPYQRVPLPKPSAPNQSWSMDFIADGLVDGRRLRCLVIVDDYSRECLAIEVDTSITGTRVVAVLERLAEDRGLPHSITVDHGPEFEGQVLDAWAYAHRLQLSFMKGRLEHDGIVLGQRLGEGENRIAIGVDPEIAPLLAFVVDATDLDKLLMDVQTVEHGRISCTLQRGPSTTTCARGAFRWVVGRPVTTSGSKPRSRLDRPHGDEPPELLVASPLPDRQSCDLTNP